MHEAAAYTWVSEIVVEEGGVAVVRVAKAGGGAQIVRDMVRGLPEARDRGAPQCIQSLEIQRAGRDFWACERFPDRIRQSDRVGRIGILGIEQVLRVRIGDARMHEERTGDPVEGTAGLRAQVELLGHRIVLVRHVLVVLATVYRRRQRYREAALRVRSALVHVLQARQGLERHRTEVVGRGERRDRLLIVVDAGPIARLVPGIGIRVEDVLALRLVLDHFRVLNRTEQRKILVRLQQGRKPHVIVIDVVEAVIPGEGGRGDIAVLLVEIAGKAQRQRTGDRQVDGGAHMHEVQRTELGIRVALDRVEGRLHGDDVQRAADRILAEDGALRSAQHLEVIEVQEAKAQ